MGRVELLSALVIYLSPYIYYCFGEGVAALWILDTTLYYWHLCFLETHKMNVCTLMFWAPECSLEIEDQNIGFYRKLLSSCLIFSLRSYLTLCLFKKSKDGSFYLPLMFSFVIVFNGQMVFAKKWLFWLSLRTMLVVTIFLCKLKPLFYYNFFINARDMWIGSKLSDDFPLTL